MTVFTTSGAGTVANDGTGAPLRTKTQNDNTNWGVLNSAFSAMGGNSATIGDGTTGNSNLAVNGNSSVSSHGAFVSFQSGGVTEAQIGMSSALIGSTGTHLTLLSNSTNAIQLAPSGQISLITQVGNAIGGSPNAAACGIFVYKDTTTSRSINAAGTVNASGTDYAEYETKADGCGTIEKGQIVGFDKNGRLTDKWAEAISFGVKSTAPSYVGGDGWGNENALGLKRPGSAPTKPVPAVLRGENETDVEWISRQADAGFDAGAHAQAVKDWEAASAQHATNKAAFDAAHETARQTVDRIAYSGKVPVNVKGAQVGDYIVAMEVLNGDRPSGIGGATVRFEDVTFVTYRYAVGRVRRILDDGRAEIAVMVH